MNKDQEQSKILRLKFWDGHEAEVDLNDVASRSLSVKGASFRNPLRFLEIYSELLDSKSDSGNSSFGSLSGRMDYDDVKRRFFPQLPWQIFEIGAGIEQPPFCWKDTDVKNLCVNFTYNSNAFYRIFKNLSSEGKIPQERISNLLDQACILLAQIYMAGQFEVIKHINNNFNMYLISKVVEELLGKEIYSSEEQELVLTNQSLATALRIAPAFLSCSAHEKMGFALGMGVAFIEQRIQRKERIEETVENTKKVACEYFHQSIAIDDRARLMKMISDASTRKTPFTVAAVLDDATETVMDLLWMQDLMTQFPHFHVNLLVNTAQVSINFSSHMLEAVFLSQVFGKLASQLGKQFFVTKMYCPFISFQTNYLSPNASRVIRKADIVYIKGANFFETFQIPEKDCFHAFVVFGPISRAYSGFEDYSAVFAYIPRGMAGYIHHSSANEIVTVREIVRNRDGGACI